MRCKIPEAEVRHSVLRWNGIKQGVTRVALAAVVSGLCVVGMHRLIADDPSATRDVVSSVAAVEPEHKVLADEWNERISNDGYWRGRPSGQSFNAKGVRGKPSQLQGPAPSPNWFIAPPSQNSWFADPPRQADPGAGLSSKSRNLSGYRTVCVRQCDGFFFPISFGGSESSFSRDQATCTNSCSGAKLYYYKASSEDPDDMVDLEGRSYAKMKNANLFRTQYVEACKCKPHPWEQEASDKHRIYALEDQRRRGNRAVLAELEDLKSKNRVEKSSNRGRSSDRNRRSLPKGEASTAVPVVTAVGPTPRSDASRGQGGSDRVAAQGAAPSIVTGAVAAAASDATVQSVVARQSGSEGASSGNLTVRLGTTAELGAAQPGAELVNAAAGAQYYSQGIQAIQAPEPALAPEPANGPVISAPDAGPATASTTNGRQSRKSSRRERGQGQAGGRPDNMMRLGGGQRQADARRAGGALQGRSTEWTGRIFSTNP